MKLVHRYLVNFLINKVLLHLLGIKKTLMILLGHYLLYTSLLLVLFFLAYNYRVQLITLSYVNKVFVNQGSIFKVKYTMMIFFS